jgi:hypothetical protein
MFNRTHAYVQKEKYVIALNAVNNHFMVTRDCKHIKIRPTVILCSAVTF